MGLSTDSSGTGAALSNRKAKHIFVTGGVVSSLGKGITAASLGLLLKSRGYKVTMQKLDPYLNIDPGMMSPYQHGEVFVTEDGAETDLDLGHYERFVDEAMTRDSSVTSGSVYYDLIQRERTGDFSGGTIQVVPHLTNEVKDRIKRLALDTDADFVITEVGGTVGDIESLPFVEAIRQMRRDVGRENVCYIHVTLVPWLEAAHEMKTKPTQHSVQQLRSQGIHPNFVVCRCEREIEQDLLDKVALFCDIETERVLTAQDSESLLLVPRELQAQGFDTKILERFGMALNQSDLSDWCGFIEKTRSLRESVRIALVGKYVQLPDAYLSVTEALDHAGVYHDHLIQLEWIDAGNLSPEEVKDALKGFDGILVPGGFGERGSESKKAAAQFARENKVPFLGICLGMQMAVAEFARNVADMKGAGSYEFDPSTSYPVIHLLSGKEGSDFTDGAMRLGAKDIKITPNSIAHEIYTTLEASERHRHRQGINNEYRKHLEDAGLVVSGTSTCGEVIEMIELPRSIHPWFVGTQGHPEFKSRATRPSPVFASFIGAAITHKEQAS
ncbi:MAG: CTP synthase [Coriobacteriia bacterium]|nr:CTP synthase [Coriobacteriia bacterium]MCL2746083.1 CTP synthase [Coriobacteriia bacterium]MCL2870150.1 CTP synthase [Coriobacteriia bacterium]